MASHRFSLFLKEPNALKKLISQHPKRNPVSSGLISDRNDGCKTVGFINTPGHQCEDTFKELAEQSFWRSIFIPGQIYSTNSEEEPEKS